MYTNSFSSYSYSSYSFSLPLECLDSKTAMKMNEEDDEDLKKSVEEDILKAFLEEDFKSQHYDSIWEVFKRALP